MDTKPLIFWGATGQSIMLEECLRQTFHLEAIFDNNPKITSPFKDVPINYGWETFLTWLDKKRNNHLSYMVAIGGGHGEIRLEIHEKIKNLGLKPISAIHNSSYVSVDAILAEGIQVLPNATINPRVSIGKCSIINTAASIDHECTIGNGVHIGPSVTLAGCIEIGDYSFIGTNSTILPKLKIGKKRNKQE